MNDKPIIEMPVDLNPAQEVAVTGGFMELINKVAMLPGTETVDKLERMMKMQMEWEDRQEEREFNEAMMRIQKILQTVRIVKNKSVGYDKVKGKPEAGQIEAFKYATIEDIDKIVRPLLLGENIVPSYDTKAIGNGMYDITCILTRGRHQKHSTIPLPMDSSGGKNNTQGMGSTFSYGKRYSLCAALNILTVGEDNDGQGAPITDDQAKEIKDGLRETGLNVEKFLKNLKVEAVELIPTREYARAINAIDAQRFRLLKKKGDDHADNS